MSAKIAGPLLRLVEDELSQPEPSAVVHTLCDAIRARHGAGIASILFYGSCLRKNTSDGVLDFYVLVDSYREFYGLGLLALGNTLLPPNAFYLTVDAGNDAPDASPPDASPQTLHCKYAVISIADFEYCASPACVHSYIWARFAQPSRFAYIRDREAQDRVVRAVAEAVVTLTRRLGPFLPATGKLQRFSIASLWREAFRRTYAAELRPESTDATRDLFDADVDRYEVAGMAALETLASRGWLDTVTPRGTAVEVAMPPRRRTGQRWRWNATRPLAKVLAVTRLFKTAATFGDWLPYALWKLERHSGVVVELSERQRRHPLIFAWPVIFSLIKQRALR